MIPISIADFVKQTVDTNSDLDAAELTESCKDMLRRKRNGAACLTCGLGCYRHSDVLYLHDRRFR